jgi:hypothetical protein
MGLFLQGIIVYHLREKLDEENRYTCNDRLTHSSLYEGISPAHQ